MEKINLKNIIKANYLFFLILLLLIGLAYGNVTRGEFVTADDIPGIVQSPLVRDLGASIKSDYFKFLYIYRAVIYKFFGLNPHVFHSFKLIFHFINTFLVFILTYLLFNSKKTAMLTSLIFAIHPINSETVAWISPTNYMINAFFALLTLIFFVFYKQSRNIKYLVFSVCIFLLQIFGMRDAWCLITPLVVITLDIFILESNFSLKKISIKKYAYLIPFIIIAGVFASYILTYGLKGRTTILEDKFYFNTEESEPWLNRLPYSIFNLIRLLVFPLTLTIYPGESPLPVEYYKLMVSTTLVFIFFLVFLLKKNRLYAGLILLILLCVAPTMSPIQVAWFMAERYVYLGSFFFAILLSLILQRIEMKNKTIFKIIFISIVLLFTTRVILRTEDWRTNKNLWIATQKVSYLSPRVYNNLGDVYSKEKDYEKAIFNFKKAFELDPDYAEAIHNLGYTYLEMGDLESAKKYLKKSYEVNPRVYQALEKLGLIAIHEKNYTEAEIYFKKVLEIYPESVIAKRGLETLQLQKF